MPVTVVYHEEGIILNRYEGRVTLDEIIDANNRTKALAAEHHLSHYVMVVDASRMHLAVSDPGALKPDPAPQNTACAGYLVLNAPVLARALGDVARRLFRYPLFFHTDSEHALQQARALLRAAREKDTAR